jgi:integrase
LHLILADAVEDGLIPSNPAAKRRGRGKRVGRSQHRGAEKAITTAVGVLLIAERAALLSGRDDEFVAIVLMGFTGMRWGELVGLETQYVRPAGVRIEWQLYELDNGQLHRCPPKDESRRLVLTPAWLTVLVRDHIARARANPCPCHGQRYTFTGHRPPNTTARQSGPRLADVARRAGVAVGTASAVLNAREAVSDSTRARVQAAIADLGYVRGVVSGALAPHWRRNGFATWLFQPAATGWYPTKAPHVSRPVPVLADPWPGVPVRGRNAASRADVCWLPIAPGLTPHGLRHTYKTLMVELGTPATLMDVQMGHQDGSVQARYAHITPAMSERLLDGLTTLWLEALAARRDLSRGSPVTVLDRLLREQTS